METFSPLELKFSEKAISHFASSLKNNGKSDGVRIGVRKAGVLALSTFLSLSTLTKLALMILFLKKVSARSMLIQKA